MKEFFAFDQRLGIMVPELKEDWDEHNKHIQQEILLYWEKIRGFIPDRITELEKIINHKQEQLSNEIHFDRSCILNSEIAELASIINDLWIWFRKNQTISMKAHI